MIWSLNRLSLASAAYFQAWEIVANFLALEEQEIYHFVIVAYKFWSVNDVHVFKAVYTGVKFNQMPKNVIEF